MSYIPNIVTGSVARSTTDNDDLAERRTPQWLKALYAFLVAVVVVTTVSVIFAPSNASDDTRTSQCDYGKSAPRTSGKHIK